MGLGKGSKDVNPQLSKGRRSGEATTPHGFSGTHAPLPPNTQCCDRVHPRSCFLQEFTFSSQRLALKKEQDNLNIECWGYGGATSTGLQKGPGRKPRPQQEPRYVQGLSGKGPRGPGARGEAGEEPLVTNGSGWNYKKSELPGAPNFQLCNFMQSLRGCRVCVVAMARRHK